ncbi:hypothetical protein L6452_18524 [Arctium lappa]|uniref:Uncharacterized protein n=1 Tax=Arctium lappa TaxID=4217 RepID=A0ACB9C6K2_ARCLA|nr:hypothetical protein L6452_18524 [Arctium lappa]
MSIALLSHKLVLAYGHKFVYHPVKVLQMPIQCDEEEEMEEGGTFEARDHEARELHEDDFESDEEPQVDVGEEFEFNSDEERLLDIIDDDNMEG